MGEDCSQQIQLFSQGEEEKDQWIGLPQNESLLYIKNILRKKTRISGVGM
jgi:hypothetical protein